MRGIRFLVVDAAGIAPFIPSLRALERTVRYPLADGADEFFIDHGAAYHPFFTGMGAARFLLALRGDDVVGAITGVVKPVRLAGAPVPALYLCGLKVDAAMRGQGTGRSLFLRGLATILLTPELRQCRIIYGAGMRGSRGDVMNTARGWHPLRMASAQSVSSLFFVEPQRLAALPASGAPGLPHGAGLSLGAASPPDVVSTHGTKDLRLMSSGKPWPLVHLPAPPEQWGGSLAAYLVRCATGLVATAPSSLACFSLDVRLQEHHTWLARHGIAPGAHCTVYALNLIRRAPEVSWVHLPTSEI